MEDYKLGDMFKGWFVGNFSPSALVTETCEVAVKYYKAGDYEPPHTHKVATEVTLILSGQVKMNGKIWGGGDIVVIKPNEQTDFEAITDAINVVVKTPSLKNDKYLSS